MIVNAKGFDVPPPGAGLTTVIASALGPPATVSDASTVADSRPGASQVVARGDPPIYTVELATKLVPKTISVKLGLLAGTTVGLRLVSTGAGLFGDTFADVAVHGKQIEAVIRSWDGLDERDTDRVGLDYFAEVAPTVAACRKGCEDDGRCRAFSWRASDQLCWRKQGAPEPSPAAGITSGLPARFEVGVDRLGGDFAALAIGAPDACAAACARTTTCRAWTQLGGSCFLKNTIPPASTGTCPACTSGVVTRGLEQDTDRFGADYASVPNDGTPEDCAAACARDARCASFTHVGFGCFLKDSVAPASAASPSQFMTSGVRRGMDPESDRVGGDYWTFDTELRPSLCQAECARDVVNCLAWSYRPMGTFGRCTLKNAIGPRVASPTNTSGLRGTEMLPAF